MLCEQSGIPPLFPAEKLEKCFAGTSPPTSFADLSTRFLHGSREVAHTYKLVHATAACGELELCELCLARYSGLSCLAGRGSGCQQRRTANPTSFRASDLGDG